MLSNHLEATGLGVMARARFAAAGRLTVDVQVEPGEVVTEERDRKASILRVVVRDELGGAIGSVTIPAGKFRKE